MHFFFVVGLIFRCISRVRIPKVKFADSGESTRLTEVKKFFQSEQVQIVLQEEDILYAITPNVTLDELRGWYKDFKNEIENEYYKIKIIE